MTKNSKFFAVTGLLLVGTLVLSSASVRADESSVYSALAQKIAERFGLNVEEVQQIVEEHREIVQTERKVKHEERLKSLVDEGVITQSQMDALQQKQEEIRDRMEAAHVLPDSERRAKMQSIHDEMRTWVEAQGLEDVLPFHGKGLRMRGVR